ncbi:reverse transcriptase domain-containing protein [Tanacetum coccineum]
MAQRRATTPSIYHSLLPAGTPPLLPIPLPAPSGTPPLHLLFTDQVGESSSAAAARPAGGLRADYGFVATMDMEIRRDPERDVGYGITGSWDEIVETLDRRAHARTARLMETEARMSREAWGRSMMRETDGDYRDAGGRSQEAEAAHRGTEADKRLSIKMAPKRATRSNIAPETTNTTSVTNAQLQAMINQGVTAALAARDANTNGVDSHNSGTGARRNERATRECTYPDFMKCQPLNFKGTEGVVELTQWIKKMEIVFRISNYFVENQIKFSTCTLLGNALTWWNSHVRTVGNDIAYAMTWTKLKKKITDKYCLRTEIKKLKVKLWELKVKGTDVIGYNQRFQELALLCGRMFPEESDKIEKYVGGLPDMIHRKV